MPHDLDDGTMLDSLVRKLPVEHDRPLLQALLRSLDLNLLNEAADSLEAEGSTNIREALALASKKFGDDDRPHIIVLLTDGEDTVGNTHEQILGAMKNADAKVFPFGVGESIDFELLDKLANDYGDGLPTYIRSDSELESTLVSFYNRKVKSSHFHYFTQAKILL